MNNLVIKSICNSILLFIAFIFFSCNSSTPQNKIVIFSLKKIALKCDTTGNEMGRIIFELNITNKSQNPIILTRSDSESTDSLGHCFLISKKMFRDTLNLLVKNEFVGQLEVGKSAQINALLDYDKLKYVLKNCLNRNISVNDLRNFLNSKESYTLIYAPSKSSTIYKIGRSSNLQISCNP